MLYGGAADGKHPLIFIREVTLIDGGDPATGIVRSGPNSAHWGYRTVGITWIRLTDGSGWMYQGLGIGDPTVETMFFMQARNESPNLVSPGI